MLSPNYQLLTFNGCKLQQFQWGLETGRNNITLKAKVASIKPWWSHVMLTYLIESHENVVQHEQLLAEMYLKLLRFRVTRTSSCSKQVAWRDCLKELLESSPSLIYQWDMATWHLVWDSLKSHLQIHRQNGLESLEVDIDSKSWNMFDWNICIGIAWTHPILSSMANMFNVSRQTGALPGKRLA